MAFGLGLLLVPWPKAFAASRLCLWLGGTLEEADIPTAHLNHPLHILIYLPPCYAEDRYQGFPLLVLLHGQHFRETQWLDIGLKPLADRLMGSGMLPRFIIALPRETSWELPSESGFDEALMEDGLPWLQQHYRLRSGRAYRAIGGISRGGAWAIRLGLTHWTEFSAVGGHSPAVFAGDGNLLPHWLARIPPQAYPRFYVDVGDADLAPIRKSANLLEKELIRFAVPHEWHYNVGRHDNVYWQQHLNEYLRWYAQAWSSMP